MEFFRTITYFGFGIMSVAAMVFLFTTVPLEAAKPAKVDLCHLDEDTGLFKLISVSANAQAAHMNHGDKEVPLSGDCNEQPAKVFVRAYINIDGQPGYNAATDIIIAQVVDNGDNILNAGDLLELGAYPKDFTDLTNLSNRGTFGASANPIPITDVSIDLPNAIRVTAGGDDFEFNPISNTTSGEGLSENGINGTLRFGDVPTSNYDIITIPATAVFVSQPEGPLFLLRFNDSADSDFINVEMNLAGL